MSKDSVFCLARNLDQGEAIVNDLRTAGLSNEDISVLFADKTGNKDLAYTKHTKVSEGATTGGTTGGLLGGALGWLAGIGSLAIPGAGPFIAAGPILAALSGAAIGAAAGGMTGALLGLGVPEYEVKQYEGKIQEGNMLISVHVEDGDEKNRVKAIFKRYDADAISSAQEKKVAGKQGNY